MVSETETVGAVTDNCMDEVDMETMKVVQEQFLSADADEIKEVSEHSKQVSNPSLLSLMKCGKGETGG
ncbi:unnamed protein product [Brugia pahangi]|uniref:Ovule protein n=1 Tax=Brugia pahangi TaxID=6280 RepID=A0A0N4T296_BRUPA|nr:unnamed protein product [Brugia pahangi]